MLVTTNPQRTLWEALLPPGYEQLPPRLARVDALFDDPVFFEPYRAYFSAELGRPLWETVLPPGYQDLPAQLARVDALLTWKPRLLRTSTQMREMFSSSSTTRMDPCRLAWGPRASPSRLASSVS